MAPLLFVFCVAALAAALLGRPLSLLVVTGGHEFEASFFELFHNQPGWTWQHRAHLDAAEAFDQRMAGVYDVVLLYDMAQEITDRQKRNLLEYIASGGGLVVLHHALASFQEWPEYAQMIGGKYLLRAEGEQSASTFQHNQDVDVRPEDVEHPVTRGLTAFRIRDEVYGRMWVSLNVTVLLTAREGGQSRPVAWISPHLRARIVCIQLGHGDSAYRHPAFRALLEQAIPWAARR